MTTETTTKRTRKPYGVVGALMKYETEGLSEAAELKLFRYLLRTGMIYQLQGSYHRRAQQLIDEGLLRRPRSK